MAGMRLGRKRGWRWEGRCPVSVLRSMKATHGGRVKAAAFSVRVRVDQDGLREGRGGVRIAERTETRWDQEPLCPEACGNCSMA